MSETTPAAKAADAATADNPADHVHSSFLSLPLELIDEVARHLYVANNRKDLCSLARTCRMVQPICEDYIYRTVELRDTGDLGAVCRAFSQRARRAEAIHTLKILYKYHAELAGTTSDRQAFNTCVARMKSLREWYIESPFDNFKWEDEGGAEWVAGDMDVFRQALETASLHRNQPRLEDVGLARLQKLTIHSHGPDADFWELAGFECLFRHPALRHLHISCVTLPADLPELEHFAGTTPLETLIFDECELEPASLGRILSTPKALKHLALGENIANVRRNGFFPRLTSAPEATLQALMPVAHSLETLTHHDPSFAVVRDMDNPPFIRLNGWGMRDFIRLKSLECDRCSFLHRAIISSHALAPPALETLRLRHYLQQVEFSDFFDLLPDFTPYTYLPSLKLVEFVQPLTVRPRFYRLVAEHICQHDAVLERHAFAYQLWKCGIQTKMYAEMHRARRYIPPYLNGEPVPQLLLVYDSQELGFHRRIVEDESDVPVKESVSAAKRKHSTLDSAEQDLSPIERELPETDKLNDYEILRLQNEVYRSIITYQYNLHGAARSRSPSPNTFQEMTNPEYEWPVHEADESSSSDDDSDDSDDSEMEEGEFFIDMDDGEEVEFEDGELEEDEAALVDALDALAEEQNGDENDELD